MDIYFRKFGKGKPLIILHGLFGLSDNWSTIGKKLSENFEVYIPDMRNHGQSSRSHEFSHEFMSE
ncbi:MAG: alpha/beta fold hydrolase [Bacteroidota bacterium]|nr:alpha/beta fold hydrolase [Bacteroidota bacterium]